MEDTRIIELFFARSERAIKETKEKYSAYLSQVAYHILRNVSDVEEILNDTYMGAWNAIPPTRPDNLRHFLSRITRNLSFDRLDYKTAGKRQTQLVELDECIPDMRNDVENVWEAKEIGQVLNSFLGTLDAKSCAVFVARYYYSHSIDELAKEYTLSARQIKYILSKNRAKLKKYLEKEGIVF